MTLKPFTLSAPLILVITSSDNGLLPNRLQAIAWGGADISVVEPLKIYSLEIPMYVYKQIFAIQQNLKTYLHTHYHAPKSYKLARSYTYPHAREWWYSETRHTAGMVYNCLYYVCCFLYFVDFGLHMFNMVFSACIHALHSVNAKLYYRISMFIHTQQLTSITISRQPLTAMYVFNFTVDDIQYYIGNG